MSLELFFVDRLDQATLFEMDIRCPHPMLCTSLAQNRDHSLFFTGGGALLDAPFPEMVPVLMYPKAFM